MSGDRHGSHASTFDPVAVPPGRLWSGVLVAPAAWIAQGALGWYWGYTACTTLTPSGARATLAVLTIAALVASVTGLAIAWTNWGRITRERHVTEVNAWDRVEFMSAGGVLISGVFTLGIAWAGLTAVMLDRCGGMR